ncbi:hypothetical protein ABRY23_12225 [Melioribacteraceae bacterium 4301-Me]|uniref:hypothetical protein n=1 Tax=Pyranulibacter aquaticus TaxID=3163344 RepID=UPI0035980C2E
MNISILNKINKLLDTAVYYLETLDEADSDYKLTMLNKVAQEIIEEKKFLKEKLDSNTLRELEKKISPKYKLLKETLDNIIEKKEEELEAVSLKLKYIKNQKKLTIYTRR